MRIEMRADGILLARIDMPGRSMNVFSAALMDSLEGLLERAEHDGTVRAVVLTSAKPSFLAGADLEMIREFTERARTGTHEELHALCGRLSRLFRRIERCAKPWVAAINGLALGGGLEVCLACHARVASDAPGLVLGLPEVKLGLLPGAGGTQRLPRLIGTLRGLQMLLGGEPLDAGSALACGLVDEVVAPERLIEAACARAHALAVELRAAPWDRPGAGFPSEPFDFLHPESRARITATLGLEPAQLARYPAYGAILDCVIGGWTLPMDEACHHEMDCFVRLIRDPVAGNMVRTLFLERQRADKIAPQRLDARAASVGLAGQDAANLAARLSAAGAPLAASDSLGPSDVCIVEHGGRAERGIGLAWLAGTEPEGSGADAAALLVSRGARAAIWLSHSGPFGAAVEVFVPGGDTLARDAGILVARWLRATVLVTGGMRPLLPALIRARSAEKEAGGDEDAQNVAVAREAARVRAEGGIEDAALADVAAVLAGALPAYTGGPYTYLRQHQVQGL